MGPFGSAVFESTPSLMIPQPLQRSRNSSGESFSSADSANELAVFTPPTPTSGLTDLGTLAMLLSSGALQDNLNAQDSSKSVGSSRYKTEKCRSYMETGQCKYGEKCQFAHGNTEQRAMPRHPKYKTELCRTFHTTGLCPYGTRCHFIHNEDPMKLGAILHAKQQFIAQQATQEMAKQAAALRANQVIQGQLQLHALVSQVQHQLVTNIAMQNTVNAAMQSSALPPTRFLAQVAHVPHMMPPQLPVSMPLMSAAFRTSLGSVADSPPVSPPCGSPVFGSATSSPKSGCDVSPPPGFAPLVEVNRNSVKNAFDFSTPCSNDSDFLSQVLYDMKNIDLDSSSSSVSSGYTPPSSPESFCQSPLDSPRFSRLPIFNKIAGESSQ